ncbi:hypothetical protein ONS95_000480 [Cadophora gregata]|uniref:uncharacterized protein n=1 Tax=Cadophora gregata TaxID=51156 RepID=UPI0026DDBA68|nr:uncharacterized protein ONS95_000480 [Cadophora gregata]KAK0125512.1 hypothetical protein ONS96_009349 [Cadophora gregata f. sp. sojae]KAK0128510.1 hypothetical protein ONS95_000480 [Cadophora gregata]
MPPKPFNPPRPTSNAPLPGAKPRGRPKGSTNNPSTTTKRKSANTLEKPSKSKSKTTTKEKEREGTSGFGRPRVSNASTVFDVASSDEDEDDEEEDTEMGDGEDVAEDDDDPFSSQPLPATASARRKSSSKANGDSQQEAGAGLISNRQTSIPPDLINVLLHGFFQHDNTRMSKDANAAVGRYIETFVREGLTRADYWKKHGWEEGGVNGYLDGTEVGGGDGAYLEVEDLERLAPQLILDF